MTNGVLLVLCPGNRLKPVPIEGEFLVVKPIVGSVNRITVTERIKAPFFWYEGPLGPYYQF